jgi:ribonuclease P protein component
MGFYDNKKLSEKAQFDAVFANKKANNGKYLKIYWRNNDVEYARIGISIAKRNINKAVARNKLRRIIKESFRINHKLLPAVDMVFVIKKQASIDSTTLFFDELNKKWSQFAIDKNT